MPRRSVLIFTTIDCPIANRYAPEIARLHREFATAGHRVLAGVRQPARHRPRRSRARQALRLRDAASCAIPSTRWCKRARRHDHAGGGGPRPQRTACVPRAHRRSLRRLRRRSTGADAPRSARGAHRRRRRTPGHGPRDAGHRVRARRLPCHSPRRHSPGTSRPSSSTRAASCHRPGGPGPFSLLTHADGATARDANRAGDEEPLHAAVEGGRGRRTVRRAAAADAIARLRCIEQWVDGGRARRRSVGTTPKPPTRADGWQLGTPDLVVTTPEAVHAPGRGRPTSFASSRFRCRSTASATCAASSSSPAMPRVVHHANIRLDYSPATRQLDARRSGARLRRPDAAHGRLSRTATSSDGRRDRSRRSCRARSRGRFNPAPISSCSCTCSRAARPRACSRVIGLYFSKEPPTRTPAILRLGSQGIDIPPGDGALHDQGFVRAAGRRRAAGRAAARALPLARRATAPRRCRMARRRSLIHIEEWDFRWQHVYRYERRSRCRRARGSRWNTRYDNSDAQSAQSGSAAAARVLGPAHRRRDGRPVVPAAAARRTAISRRSTPRPSAR